ncbi:hypothetical protein XCR_2072 [Xanthomonas campestris pv. raphani 756C]|nr:hypothetical protein XCR_2072 [Xanthomonas campestris pv. raphani 756C]
MQTGGAIGQGGSGRIHAPILLPHRITVRCSAAGAVPAALGSRMADGM